MNTQLIPVFAGELSGAPAQLVDARLLHSFLESARDFSNWITQRIKAYSFVENQDYLVNKFVEQLPSGSKHKIDYHLSIDMAKELGMIERNDKGRQIRRYFIEMERLAHQSPYGLKQLPEPKTKKALPGGLTLEQQDCIKALVSERSAQLPKEKQGAAARALWSAIKSKFSVGYKEVPAEQFTAVVSLIARIDIKDDPLLHVTPLELAGLVEQQVKQALTGELLPKDCPKYHYPITVWNPIERHGHTAYLTYQELTRIEAMNRPLWRLLYQLKQDGNDIAGAEAEYNALKLLMDVFHRKLDGLKSIFETLDSYGENIYLA